MIATHFIDGLEVLSCEPNPVEPRPTPIVFVHGAFAGAWMWETFMPFLAESGYRCYAVSLRGHGGSDGQDHINWHSIADYVDDVAAVLRWLGEPAVLVGHSMGGFIVQKTLERHEAPAAALICSVPPQGLVASQFHLLLQKPQLFFEINNIMGGGQPSDAILRDALFAQEVSDEVLNSFLARMQSESQRAIWDMSMFNLPLLPLMKRPPMLVLGAEKDVLVPAFVVQATARTYGLPDRIFHDMGHVVTHEKKWPLAAATLRDWLLETVP
ncbi:MAG: alpha/beta hydrolase [Rhodocyclaceae bacterium]|nr:alpha/beta hydrolase [Rhodocyclaceae bacterium]